MLPNLSVVIAIGVALAWIVNSVKSNYMPFPTSKRRRERRRGKEKEIEKEK
jgi:hypothetical protein